MATNAAVKNEVPIGMALDGAGGGVGATNIFVGFLLGFFVGLAVESTDPPPVCDGDEVLGDKERVKG